MGLKCKLDILGEDVTQFDANVRQPRASRLPEATSHGLDHLGQRMARPLRPWVLVATDDPLGGDRDK